MIQTKLSRQEERIALLAVTGCSDQQVATELNLSLDTVRTYWKRIRKKMGGKTRAQIIADVSRAPVTAELEASRLEADELKAEMEKRRKAEEALKLSEAKYKAIFDNTLDVIFLRTNEGIILEANPCATQLLGFSRKELVGHMYTEFVAPEAQHEIRANTESLARRGSWEGQLIMLKKDGGKLKLAWKSVANVLPGQILGIGRT